MKKVPFNVSARTARLIGRENVSSAEGALIELVKNSYDADASFCIVYFDDEFAELPRMISEDRLEVLCELLGSNKLSGCYSRQLFESDLLFSPEIFSKLFTRAERNLIESQLSKTVSIYILDNGDGMLEETIEKSWMTIGTDHKFQKFVSEKSGRVRSGAKGIGRFALDRLGERCNLLTKVENSDFTLEWRVNWNDFDSQGLTIDKVNAILGPATTDLDVNFNSILELQVSKDSDLRSEGKGTHIHIGGARDNWGIESIEKIFAELESLVPPAEAGDFSVYLFSSKYADRFGKVEPTTCDDYDCKVVASMDEGGLLNIEIKRQEIDPLKITDSLMKRAFFKNERYSREHLCEKSYKYKRKLSQLIPGIDEHDELIHTSLGKFEFVFYFLKRLTNSVDTETFMHRAFDSEARKKWLNNNSGIRIYRDNFRVRPYGEVGKTSWDWLGLGKRQADDPSALRSGRWKVPPNNISGVVKISRINNLGLEDKSSREGIQENDTFALFKSVLESIVREFEHDRGSIYKEVYNDFLSRKEIPTDEELKPAEEADAEVLAQKIFNNLKKDNKEVGGDSDKLALALLKEKARSREIDDRLEEMKKENSLLRVFASSGITIAAFTHELDSLNTKLGGRFDQLEKLFGLYANMSQDERKLIPIQKDPYKRIEMLRRDDERVRHWIKYSLRTIRKDKRNRTKLNLRSYLENLRDEWNSTLIDRQVAFEVSVASSELSIRAYEIDLDCIFNNLIINSVDAFKRSGFFGSRLIRIHIGESGSNLVVQYRDSGPGLSPSILNPTDIFQPTFTTKVNKQGQDIGTGLGMWLVQKTLEEYGGKAVLNSGVGFSMTMELKKW